MWKKGILHLEIFRMGSPGPESASWKDASLEGAFRRTSH